MNSPKGSNNTVGLRALVPSKLDLYSKTYTLIHTATPLKAVTVEACNGVNMDKRIGLWTWH